MVEGCGIPLINFAPQAHGTLLFPSLGTARTPQKHIFPRLWPQLKDLRHVLPRGKKKRRRKTFPTNPKPSSTVGGTAVPPKIGFFFPNFSLGVPAVPRYPHSENPVVSCLGTGCFQIWGRGDSHSSCTFENAFFLMFFCVQFRCKRTETISPFFCIRNLHVV